MTACAETVIERQSYVPYVDPALFVQEPAPVLKANPASWSDLALLAFELLGWGRVCYAKVDGIEEVLATARAEVEGDPGPQQ